MFSRTNAETSASWAWMARSATAGPNEANTAVAPAAPAGTHEGLVVGEHPSDGVDNLAVRVDESAEVDAATRERRCGLKHLHRLGSQPHEPLHLSKPLQRLCSDVDCAEDLAHGVRRCIGRGLRKEVQRKDLDA